jgi:hypothetical protein
MQETHLFSKTIAKVQQKIEICKFYDSKSTFFITLFHNALILSYSKKTDKMAEKWIKICIFQKKVVPLHDFCILGKCGGYRTPQ